MSRLTMHSDQVCLYSVDPKWLHISHVLSRLYLNIQYKPVTLIQWTITRLMFQTRKKNPSVHKGLKNLLDPVLLALGQRPTVSPVVARTHFSLVPACPSVLAIKPSVLDAQPPLLVGCSRLSLLLCKIQ